MKRKHLICGLVVGALLTLNSACLCIHYSSRAAIIQGLGYYERPDYLAARSHADFWNVSMFITGLITGGFLVAFLRSSRRVHLNDPGKAEPTVKEASPPKGIRDRCLAVFVFFFLGLLVGVAAYLPSMLFYSLPLKGASGIEGSQGFLSFLALTVVAFVAVPVTWFGTCQRRLAESYPRFVRSRLILLFSVYAASFVVAVMVFPFFDLLRLSGHDWIRLIYTLIRQVEFRDCVWILFLAPPTAASLAVVLSAFRHDKGVRDRCLDVFMFFSLGLVVGFVGGFLSALYYDSPLKGALRNQGPRGILLFLVLTVVAFVAVPATWFATCQRRLAESYPRFVQSRLILLFSVYAASFIVALTVTECRLFSLSDHVWILWMFFLAPPMAAILAVVLSAFRHDYQRDA